MKLIVKQFRVMNYRNINDSGWIPLERVTAFVGRNEAGKTALLKSVEGERVAARPAVAVKRSNARGTIRRN